MTEIGFWRTSVAQRVNRLFLSPHAIDVGSEKTVGESFASSCYRPVRFLHVSDRSAGTKDDLQGNGKFADFVAAKVGKF